MLLITPASTWPTYRSEQLRNPRRHTNDFLVNPQSIATSQSHRQISTPTLLHHSKKNVTAACLRSLYGVLRIPAQPGQHSERCRVSVPADAGLALTRRTRLVNGPDRPAVTLVSASGAVQTEKRSFDSDNTHNWPRRDGVPLLDLPSVIVDVAAEVSGPNRDYPDGKRGNSREPRVACGAIQRKGSQEAVRTAC
jgi:hypothetical protein